MGFAWHLSLLLVSACIYDTHSFGRTTNKNGRQTFANLERLDLEAWKTSNPRKCFPELQKVWPKETRTTLLLCSQVPKCSYWMYVALLFPVLRGCFECFWSLISCCKFPYGLQQQEMLMKQSNPFTIPFPCLLSCLWRVWNLVSRGSHLPHKNQGMPWKAKWKPCQHFSKRMLEIGATIVHSNCEYK